MELASNPSPARHSEPPRASRIAGQGRILRSLRSLARRVERFAAHRARTRDEQQWAGQMADRLEEALTIGMQSAAARQSLASADRRAAIGRKAMSRPTI